MKIEEEWRGTLVKCVEMFSDTGMEEEWKIEEEWRENGGREM